MPDIVKKYYQQKHGYANYFFNNLNLERISKTWNAGTRLADRHGAWSISGSFPNGGAYQFALTDDQAEFKGPSLQSQWNANSGLGSLDEPPHSGGLLPALWLWRRLAVEGFGRFGDVYYLGTAPLVGREDLVDVLVGTYKVVDCRFYFDPAEGHLLAVEMFPEENADPCEVYFSQFHDVAGHILPGRMEVRYGDEIIGVFTIDDFTFETTVQK
jgi:serine protease Do